MPSKAVRKWSRQKSKSAVKLAILMLALVAIILIVGAAVRFTRSLFKPLINEPSRHYLWDGQSQINLVLKTDQTALLSFDPNAGTLKIVTVAPETYVDVPGNFGSWSIRSVYPLGESENPPEGVVLIKGAMSNFLGLPVDGFLEVDVNRANDAVNDLRQSPLMALGGLSKIKTDLTPLELLRLYFGVAGIRFDKISFFNLTGQDRVQIDDFVSQNFYDSKLRQEQLSVAVFNGTRIAGKAKQAARIISNLGGHVIIQNNFEENNINSSFIFSKTTSYTSKRLMSIFGLDCPSAKICDKLWLDGQYSRADVDVVLGSDF